MAELHRLPDIKHVERQASEWIARLNADDVSDDDRVRFEAWRAAHQLHARLYDKLVITWQSFVSAGPLVRAVSFGQSMNEATCLPAPRHRWMASAAAAAVAMIVMVAGLWYRVPASQETVFQTAVGEHATISLPDGSLLELNTNSLARVDYAAHSRVIRLERGQAYFQVAHDTQRPFWVAVDGSWVRAVGTAFDVQRRTNGALVTVSEGTVKVGLGDVPRDRAQLNLRLDQAPASTVTVGQQGEVQDRSIAVHSLSAGDLSRSNAWRSGLIDFENRSLREVVDEISRYTTLQLIVNDARLGDLHLGGMFEASPRGAESFVTMLQDGFGLHIRRESNRVYIEPGKNDGRQSRLMRNSSHSAAMSHKPSTQRRN